MPIPLAIPVLCLVAAPPQAPDVPRMRLELRPAAGQPVTYLLREQQHTRMAVGSTIIEASLSFEHAVELTFDEPDAAGRRRCRVRYGALRGRIASPPFVDAEFDTANDAHPIPPMLASMIGPSMLLAGRTVQAVVDARGRIVDLSGFREIFAGSVAERYAGQAGSRLDDASRRGDVQVYFPILPPGAIAPGSVWHHAHPVVPLDRELTLEAVCCARRIDAHRAQWTFATRAGSGDGAERPADWLDGPMGVLDAAVTGSVSVACADGLLLSQVLDAEYVVALPGALQKERVDTLVRTRIEFTRQGAAPEPAERGALPPLDGDPGEDEGVFALHRSARGVLRGDEPPERVPDPADPGLALEARCDHLRGSVTEPGAYHLTLRAPGLDAVLDVRCGDESSRRARTDARGHAKVEVDCRLPPCALAVRVAAAEGGRGPYVVSLERAVGETTVDERDRVAGAAALARHAGIRFTPEDLFLRDPEETRRTLDYMEFLAESFRVDEFPALDAAHLLGNIAMGYHFHGDARGARDSLDAAWKRLAEAPDDGMPIRFDLLRDELVLLVSGGDVGRVRAVIDEMLARLEHPSVTLHSALLALQEASTALAELGDPRAALDLVQRAFALAEEGAGLEARDESALRGLTASALVQLGRTEEALAEWQRSVAILLEEAGEDDLGLSIERTNLSVALLSLGRVDEAQGCLERALAVQRAQLGEDHPRTARTRLQLAWVAARLGNLDAAIDGANAALDVFRRWYGIDHDSTSSARQAATRWLTARGDGPEAWSLALEEMQAEERRAGAALRTLSERERLLYFQHRRSALDLLLALDDEGAPRPAAETTFEAVVRWKGSVSRSLTRPRTAQTEPGAVHDLTAAIGRLQAEIAALVLSDAGERAGRLRDLAAERDVLQRRLAARLQAPDSQPGDEVARLRSTLPAASALVVYLAHGSDPAKGAALSAWVLRADGGAPLRVPLGPLAPAAAAAREWLAAISPRAERGLAAGAAAAGAEAGRAAGARARERIWDPLAAHLVGVDTVVVSPETALASLPLGVLPTGDGGFLIEAHDFTYLADPLALLEPAGSRAPAGGLLLLGGLEYGGEPRGGTRAWTPLPGTRREVEALAVLHREAALDVVPPALLTGGAGTETALRERLAGYGTLHLATHGFSPRADARDGAHAPWDEIAPGACAGIVCAAPPARADGGDVVDDGLLTAEEIGWMDLSHVGLVVLSACSSGLGEPLPGEGLIGLRRAFRQAGARRVVSACWPVADDPTAGLMLEFHRGLWTERLGARAALRAAQLRHLRANRAASGDGAPGEWGAFVVEGAP